MTATATPERSRLSEVVPYFLRLGLLGFGGPVALVGQMERELVADRGWLTKEQMREAIAICQSLPGPLAIQVGIYISYLRAGFWGAWAGGWAFIFPNFVIVAALGALYVYLGDLQPVTAIFYGVSPAVIALILHSCFRLAKLGMDDWLQWVIAAVCLVVTVILAGRGRFIIHRCRNCRHPVLREHYPPPTVDSIAGRWDACIGTADAGCLGLDAWQAPFVFPKSGIAHIRQRSRDCPIPRAGTGATLQLA